jgi:hypothetical protein
VGRAGVTVPARGAEGDTEVLADTLRLVLERGEREVDEVALDRGVRDRGALGVAVVLDEAVAMALWEELGEGREQGVGAGVSVPGVALGSWGEGDTERVPLTVGLSGGAPVTVVVSVSVLVERGEALRRVVEVPESVSTLVAV